MLAILTVVSLTMQQPGAQAPSPVARIVVEPAGAVIAAGDSVRLRGTALDSAGRPVPGAEVRFFGGGFEGAVDQTTGVVRGGARGVLKVYAVALVPERPPSAPVPVHVRIVAPPAARVEIGPLL